MAGRSAKNEKLHFSRYYDEVVKHLSQNFDKRDHAVEELNRNQNEKTRNHHSIRNEILPVRLQRPGVFHRSIPRHFYNPYPQLKLMYPSYPQNQFPQPWGVPVIPVKKLGHPSCPPAPFFPNEKLMTLAAHKLTDYYNNTLCLDDDQIHMSVLTRINQ